MERIVFDFYISEPPLMILSLYGTCALDAMGEDTLQTSSEFGKPWPGGQTQLTACELKNIFTFLNG